MIVISGRNVNVVYPRGLVEVVENGGKGTSRNGPVITYPCPVTTVYERPCERVLFSVSRDANPFFHLLEAIWMLAGRRDAKFLTRYAKQIGEYAEEDGGIHGAYGYRWRNHFVSDQLDAVVRKLRSNPDDRQCVITMWDADADTYGAWKDRPCNTHVYLRVRSEFDKISAVEAGYGDPEKRKVLDMTVCCRSNDLIWGAYGANAVHFSVLQEYLAAAVGVGVGRMYQVSNNLHVYDNDLLRRCVDGVEDADREMGDPYSHWVVSSSPMVSHPEVFLEECEELCRRIDEVCDRPPDVIVGTPLHLKNKFLVNTVWPIAVCHYFYKAGDQRVADVWCTVIESYDWRLACTEWLTRRRKK